MTLLRHSPQHTSMKFKSLQLKVALLTAAIIIACLPSCSSGYRGYKMRPYTVRGERYHPMGVNDALNYEATGTCSWYNESRFFGLKRGTTAIGEDVMPWDVSGAHKTLPLPCKIKVTNVRNGKSVKMRINDRGPYIPGRILDVTPRAAKKLGFYDQGLTTVHIKVLSVGDGRYKKKKRRRFFFF